MKRKRQGRKVIQLFGTRGGAKPGSVSPGDDTTARPDEQKPEPARRGDSAHGFERVAQSVLDGADMDDLLNLLNLLTIPEVPDFRQWTGAGEPLPPAGQGVTGSGPDLRPDLRPDMRPDMRSDDRPNIRSDIRSDNRSEIRPDIRPGNRTGHAGRRAAPDGFAFPALDRMAARMASAVARRLYGLSTRRWQVLPATARRVRFAAWSRFSNPLTATVQMFPLEGVALLGVDAPLTHLLAARLLDRGPERRFADAQPVPGAGHGQNAYTPPDRSSGVQPGMSRVVPQNAGPAEPPSLSPGLISDSPPQSADNPAGHADPSDLADPVNPVSLAQAATHGGTAPPAPPAPQAPSVLAVAAYCLHAFQLDWEWAMAPYFEVETVRCRLLQPGETVVGPGTVGEVDTPGSAGDAIDAVDFVDVGEDEECVLITFAVSDGEQSGRMMLLFPLTMLRPLGAILAEPARLLMPSSTETDDEAFARLRSLDDAALAGELRAAHPLLAAVVLFRMADERRGRVLQLLEPAMREELVRRMGRRASMLRTLSVEQRTVVRTLLLGETHAAHVLRMCTPEAAARFLSVVATLPSLFPSQASEILSEGAPGIVCGTPLVVDGGMVTRLLMRSFTPAEAAQVSARLRSGGYALPFSCLQRCTPSGIADLLRTECLGGAALVLRHLVRIDPGLAAETFALLHGTMRPGILERVSQPRSVAADVLHAVENALCRELSGCGSWECDRSGHHAEESAAGEVGARYSARDTLIGRTAGAEPDTHRPCGQTHDGQAQDGQTHDGQAQASPADYTGRTAEAARPVPAGTEEPHAPSGGEEAGSCSRCPEGSASDACLLMAALPADERTRLAERLAQAGVALPADCLPLQH